MNIILTKDYAELSKAAYQIIEETIKIIKKLLLIRRLVPVMTGCLNCLWKLLTKTS